MPAQPGGSADLLRSAARAIHAERDRDRLLTWVANALSRVAQTSVAGLTVDLDDHARRWTMAADSDRDLAILGDPRTMAQFTPLLQGDLDRLTGDEHLRRLLSLQVVTVLAIPRAPLGVHGLVILGWGPNQAPPTGWLDLAETLIAHLGVALDNQLAMADLESAQRGVLHKLQEAVRPPTPAVPQTELGVYYLAADQQASMGGDLYDWVLLADGTLHLAVVDVMGKGVSATKDAVAVTHALRLLVLEGVPLECIVGRTDALLTAQNPDLVATLMIGRYHPATGVLQLAGGGHPPLLVVHAKTAKWVDAGGTPIGFPGAGSDGVVTVSLDRSDSAVFYTDGLVESTKDILKGLDTLAHHASEVGDYPASSLARALVERSLLGAIHADDSLALVLRRRSPPSVAPRTPLAPLEYRFTPSTAAVPLARHLLEDWLVRVPVDRGEAAGLLLVATELAANAVRHASGHPGGVALRASVHGPDVMLEVEDDGAEPLNLPAPGDEVPDGMAERGRGLFLVRALVDQLDSEVVEGHTVVRALRRAVVAP